MTIAGVPYEYFCQISIWYCPLCPVPYLCEISSLPRRDEARQIGSNLASATC
jgi:hypothetical protein